MFPLLLLLSYVPPDANQRLSRVALSGKQSCSVILGGFMILNFVGVLPVIKLIISYVVSKVSKVVPVLN
jgi:hypothetical protein